MSKITIENREELLKLFKELNDGAQKSIGRSALRKSANIILKQVKSNYKSTQKGYSRDGYRSIMKNIKIRSMKQKLGVMVGNAHFIKKTRNSKDWYLPYGIMIEEGTPERFYRTKTGKTKSTGRIRGTKYFSSAVKSKEKEAVDALEKNFFIAIEKFMKKYEKK